MYERMINKAKIKLRETTNSVTASVTLEAGEDVDIEELKDKTEHAFRDMQKRADEIEMERKNL